MTKNRERRRVWLAAGVAAVAASAGVAWQLRTGQAPIAGSDPPSRGPASDIWQQRFPQPGGAELVVSSVRGRPLVLNFWASWCAPCVKEMPELDRFHRNFATHGWQVVGLAIDNEAEVVQFLDRIRVGFPVALAGVAGIDLMKSFGNDKEVLPFTMVFDRHGSPVRRHVGETNYQQLEDWARGES
jgi:thiol-disulfide isomerase/thioredoxin